MPKKSLPQRLRENLPEPVASSKHFLLWRHEWSEKRQILVKTPYYTSGRKRFGALDTPDDLKRLTSLDKAIKAFDEAEGEYDGIGLALTGDGVAAFDLDKCLNEDGELLPDHAGRYLAQSFEADGAYMEISPSGKGLRILGTSDNPDAYSQNMVEYWGEGRYVTLTGSCWANPKGWRDLTRARETLPSRERKSTPSEDEEETLVTNRVIDELRSALEAMSSDERTLWIGMGHALKTIGERGKELWLEWSAKSPKFNEADAETTWESFQPSSTSYRAVFAEAQRNWDWENPRAGKHEVQEDEDPGDLLDFQIDLGEEKLHPTEFVLDGFLPVGVSLVAGAWGSGKSTNLIPLFASVAHLTPEAWGFHPVLRRHVLWITEAPDQARDTIYSMRQAEGAASWPDFQRWFHLIPARRIKPKTLATLVKEAVGSVTYTLDNGFTVRPVVVLDTVSANLDLDNESDNSEVGAAMSRLKEALPGVPLVLIGHTPKSIVRGDVSDMTFRGAGAWEADAVATYFLMHDIDTGMRFMALGKVRFSPDYQEVSFGQEGGRKLIETQWGEPQSKAYMHGIPQKSTGDERRAAQAKAREEKKEKGKERELSERQQRIMEVVSSGVGNGDLISKTRVKDAVGGKLTVISEALERLIEADMIRVVPIPDRVLEVVFPKRAKGKQMTEVYVPNEVDSDEFFDRIIAEWGDGL